MNKIKDSIVDTIGIVKGFRIPYKVKPFLRDGQRVTGYRYNVIETRNGMELYVLPGGIVADINEVLTYINNASNSVLHALEFNASNGL